MKYIQLDITKKDDLKKTVSEYKPDVIINCAAFTDVDKCESERELSLENKRGCGQKSGHSVKAGKRKAYTLSPRITYLTGKKDRMTKGRFRTLFVLRQVETCSRECGDSKRYKTRDNQDHGAFRIRNKMSNRTLQCG